MATIAQVPQEPKKVRHFGGNFNLIMRKNGLNPFEKKQQQLEKKHLKAYLKGNKLFDFKFVPTIGGRGNWIPTREVNVIFK
jgi:hypothetical protein